MSLSNNKNNKCPLCGKDTEDGEIFCRDCQEIAENSFNEDLLSTRDEVAGSSEIENTINEIDSDLKNGDLINNKEESNLFPEAANTQDTFWRRNKASLIFLFICLILFMVVGFVGAYLRQQNMNDEKTEMAYWNKCIEENSPLGYSKYLVKYPEGNFSEEAHQKIVELRHSERQAWEKLRNSNDIDALFAFFIDHPETPYIRQIRHAVDSLSWVSTQKQNTADVYLAYLENAKIGRIDGEYVLKAQECYDYLSQLKTMEGKELDEVKKSMSDFFKAMSTDNSEAIRGLSVDTLSKFYKSDRFLSKNIIDSLKADYKTNKIRSTLYTPMIDSIDAILDNKGICFITLPVKMEITYTDKKKKKELSQSLLYIELNNKKLQTLYVKEEKGKE